MSSRCNSALDKKTPVIFHYYPKRSTSKSKSTRHMTVLLLVKPSFGSRHAGIFLPHFLSLFFHFKRQKRKRPVPLHSPPAGSIKTVPVAPLLILSSPNFPRKDPSVLPGYSTHANPPRDCCNACCWGKQSHTHLVLDATAMYAPPPATGTDCACVHLMAPNDA